MATDDAPPAGWTQRTHQRQLLLWVSGRSHGQSQGEWRHHLSQLSCSLQPLFPPPGSLPYLSQLQMYAALRSAIKIPHAPLMGLVSVIILTRKANFFIIVFYECSNPMVSTAAYVLKMWLTRVKLLIPVTNASLSLPLLAPIVSCVHCRTSLEDSLPE